MATVERIPTREELTCLVCRKPGVALHHVRPRSTAPEAKDDPENIAPISPHCHDLIHKKVILAQVRDGHFEWRWAKSDLWISVPVRVNKRHGCLDFATEDSAAGEQPNRERGGQTPKRTASVISAPPAAGSGREAGSAAAEAEGGHLGKKSPLKGGCTSAAAPSASLALPGTITPTSLTLPQNLSFRAWEQVGETLGGIHRASRFWIGDWLVFGEDTYHEKVAQSMDATGLEFETLANIASVCRRVPASRRRESLSFGHHTEVAAQEPDRQVELLAEAEGQGWSVRATREAVSGPSEPRPEPMGVCPQCGAEGKLSEFRRAG